MQKHLSAPAARKQRGQSLTEYILIICLIAIACIGVVKIFGEDIKKAFGNASKEVRKATKSTSR